MGDEVATSTSHNPVTVIILERSLLLKTSISFVLYRSPLIKNKGRYLSNSKVEWKISPPPNQEVDGMLRSVNNEEQVFRLLYICGQGPSTQTPALNLKIILVTHSR
jgi:hypothetical protein